MASVKTLAIIVKTLDWRDTSKVVTLFTRELGRIDAIAKGARSPKSPFRGILETMNLIESIIYVSAKRELQILAKASVEHSYPQIRSDLQKTAIVMSINELLYVLLHQGNIDQIFFDFVKHLVDELQRIKNPYIVLWYFMIKFASYLGFKPDLKDCRICGKHVKQKSTGFLLNEGAIICNECISSQGYIYKIPKSVQEFFIELQLTKYSRITFLESPKNKNFPYTDFLLDYLNFHTEQKVKLKALKYLN